MKILTVNNDQPVIPSPLGGTKFVSLLDASEHDTATVTEYPDAMLAAAKRAFVALDEKTRANGEMGFFVTLREVTSLVKYTAKIVANAEVGTTGVTLTATHRAQQIVLPEGAIKIPDFKVGDKIAINNRISPKAWMNARGEITGIKGKKVNVRMDEGDVRRINVATGKNYRADTVMPLMSLDLDEAAA